MCFPEAQQTQKQKRKKYVPQVCCFLLQTWGTLKTIVFTWKTEEAVCRAKSTLQLFFLFGQTGHDAHRANTYGNKRENSPNSHLNFLLCYRKSHNCKASNSKTVDKKQGETALFYLPDKRNIILVAVSPKEMMVRIVPMPI